MASDQQQQATGISDLIILFFLSPHRLKRKWHSGSVTITANMSEELFPTWHRRPIYSYKYLHVFIFINISINSSNTSDIWAVSSFMTNSDLFSRLWAAGVKNLRTCKHDVCICVTSAICILLLIPPSWKVITLLASQTLPKMRQICFQCVDMYLWTWRE